MPCEARYRSTRYSETLVGSGGFGKALDGLGLASLNPVGDSEFSDAAERLAQRGARDKLTQALGLFNSHLALSISSTDR
jgi:hypothetical protein